MMTTHKSLAPKQMTDKRAAHALNDQLVTIRAGATGIAAYKGGASIVGGVGNVGTVWVVAGDQAIVHFVEEVEVTRYGRTTKEIRDIATVTVPVADLMRV